MNRLLIVMSLLVSVRLCSVAGTIFVSPDGGDEVPYSTIETAARVLQDAADIAKAGDEILVGPGVYTNGGLSTTSTLTNRVTVPEGVTLRSIDGPEKTVIRGIRGYSTNSVRCVYLKRAARLIGVTVTHGGTRGELEGSYHAQSGGGVFCEDLAEVRDCIIANCTAYNYGGGVYGGAVSNCVIAGNWGLRGGGAAFSDLTSSLVISNQASHLAGGVYRSKINNCTVIRNLSGYAAGGVYEVKAERSIILDNDGGWIYPNHRWGLLNNCCTDPMPDRGVSNITSRAEAEQLGYGAPAVLFDLVPAIARQSGHGSARRNRGQKQLKAMGIEPVPREMGAE